jgi:5-methyltetrahydropteroyltriglutamate--homocysteine methyltransferase
MDLDNPGVALDRTGHPNPVPRVVGPVRRLHPVEVRDVEFLRSNTNYRIKITVPGPFTVAQQAQNDYYRDEKALALDIATAVNEEIRSLQAAGADVVQIDEPYLQARPEQARAYGVEVINRALEGIEGTTALHLCFGYAAIVHNRPHQYAFLTELRDCVVKQIAIETAQPQLDLSVLGQFANKVLIIGVLNLGDMEVETPETVASRIRSALQYVEPERLILAPDCGMKYLPREVAFGKLCALVEGARIVRQEL